MILSYNDVVDIATAININILGTENEDKVVPIVELAREHLNLEIKYRELSTDGSILGLTAYADTEYHLEINNKIIVYKLSTDEIILNSSFLLHKQTEELKNKKRFTLAHEVAHQIIFSLESEEDKEKYSKSYSMKKKHSPKELKTNEDFMNGKQML